MKKLWLLVGFCCIIFTNCERKNYVYSNTALNKPYKYDPQWDYREYHPDTNENLYRRYDPDRKEAIVKNLEKQGVRN